MRKYQNIFIVIFSFLLMLAAIFFKQNNVSQSINNAGTQGQEVAELKEIIANKERWGDKKISKKVEALESLVPKDKIQWKKKKKEISASYINLTVKELNMLTTKILNIPLQIVKLDIKKEDELYTMELACKW